jgi:Ca2+-binding RTX toxin-like protein
MIPNIVDSINDKITETATGGNLDVVIANANYTLGANLEKLILAPGTVDLDGFGNAITNILIGNDGNNFLDGLTGNDTMEGGKGNDTYLVNEVDDVVIEKTSEGTDTVETEINNYTLPLNVENLNLEDLATVLVGTGNTLNNLIIGNSYKNTLIGGDANDTLDGGTGNDTLNGGLGSDVYYVDSVGDLITGEGTDTSVDLVISSVSYTLVTATSTNVENLTLIGTLNLSGTGNTSNNLITGNVGNNLLNGGGGNDSLIGGDGNDSLIAGDGNDSLNGGAGNDSLIGGTGNDTLAGGKGNDSYVVDTPFDVIIEQLGEGTDTVTFIAYTGTYVLSDNLENLMLGDTTASIHGIGNNLNNTITGNSASNIIDGGTGTDTLIGGAGNDFYFVDNVNDVIIEVPPISPTSAPEIETVFSSITYTLGDNLENLNLTGTANLNGTGNNLKNNITGNAGKNILNGGGGNDILDGGAGADTLIGGTGSDTYIVDNVGDKVQEKVNQGIDTVVSFVNYTLPANVEVENLTLGGIDNLKGYGNNLNNSIYGNSGNNVLYGGGGDDLLFGGAGADQFNYNTKAAYSAADIGLDKSLDFTVSEDKIVLGKTTFGFPSSQTSLLASDFAVVNFDDSAKSSTAKIVYSKQTGSLFYNPNGATLGGEAIFLQLPTTIIPSVSDFLLES